MIIETGKEYVSGNTFAPKVEKVLSVTNGTVRVLCESNAPSIQKYTTTVELFAATRYESVEQMEAEYAAKAAA